MSFRSPPFLALCFSGVFLGVAALFPDSWWALGFASLALVLWAWGYASAPRVVLGFFLSGCAFSAIAFYWLPSTFTLFGGFPRPISIGVFLVFVVTSALQFALVAWLSRRFQSRVGQKWILFPFLWWLSELFFPRMFPWGISHNFLIWKSLAAVGSMLGSFSLSLVILLWTFILAEIVACSKRYGRVPHRLSIVALLLLAIPLFAGAYHQTVLQDEMNVSPRVKIGVVQGNLHAQKGADVLMLTPNLQTYARLSKQAQAAGAQFLVWPESVMNRWTPTALSQSSLRGTEYDPFPEGEGRLIYGTMTYEPKSDAEIRRLREAGLLLGKDDEFEKYNSAVAAHGGQVLGFYHKRVLMPFGEFLPLASRFPQLRKLSPYSGNLSSGRVNLPLTFPAEESEGFPLLKAGVLICYEDLVPSLSRDYARAGANILVNITNDAWYGVSHAQAQHNMLAAWRAVESGLVLVRGTNTGMSAVIEPSGVIRASIPLYEEGYQVLEVPLLSGQTIYVRLGEYIQWGLLLIFGLALFLPPRREKRRGQELETDVDF